MKSNFYCGKGCPAYLILGSGTSSGGLDTLKAGGIAGVGREHIYDLFVLCEPTGISMISLPFNSRLFDKALATLKAVFVICLFTGLFVTQRDASGRNVFFSFSSQGFRYSFHSY